MKSSSIQSTIHFIREAILSISVLFLLLVHTQCSPDDPEREDVPELITGVSLKFTPFGGGAPIVINATDPDGEGVADITADGPIELAAGTTYTMEISLVNGLLEPSEAGYDISEEVAEEGEEHMFFFSWTESIFSAPGGNGNIDNRTDPVQYQDLDAAGRPIGLITTWSTSSNAGAGMLRIVLKHQPETKTDSSGFSVGETDMDIVFDLVIQ